MADSKRIIKRSAETFVAGALGAFVGVGFATVVREVAPGAAQTMRELMSDEARQLGLYIIAATSSIYRIIGPDYLNKWPGPVSEFVHILSWTAMAASKTI